MGDKGRRELERRVASGDTRLQGALDRVRQRSCEHKWYSLGIFQPGFADMSGGNAGPEQVKVHICWNCHALRLEHGGPLCYFCNGPAKEESPLFFLTGTREDYGSHKGCATEFKAETQP